jgi:hypothetical protein
MSRGRQTFKQGDITKAVKAVAKAGVSGRVELDAAEGKIVIVVGQPTDGSVIEANEWDSVK